MEHSASLFALRLKELYLEQRDMAGLLSCMDEQVTWIGTGTNEVSCGLAEAGAALEREMQEYSGTFQVMDFYSTVVPLCTDACVIYGSFRATPTDYLVEEQELRFTCVCQTVAGELQLLHGHFSRADCVQEPGRHFVGLADRSDNAALRDELECRQRQLESLTRNIPGGAHQCKNDADFTLMNVSDGFLSMFGYSREEIHDRFDDKFINMVYPGDRTAAVRRTYEQLQDGPTLDLEYRILCRDGSTMWVLDKGRLLNIGREDECLYCILIDITQRMGDQEALRLSLERHQVIVDQATDIIFEWDIRRDTLNFSRNWEKKFGYTAISSSISSTIPLSQNIHPEDIDAFIKLMRDTAAGVPYSESEFRIKNTAGRYTWCRIRATTQYNDEGQAITAVGVILDIDAEKKQTQALLEQAQRDALTGLYNKAAINSLVEERMAGSADERCQALMILDVDNFKGVNDTFGHLAGDTVLSDVAATLKECVRASDLVGRIGGDEFLVYLSDVADTQVVLAKAERILEALHTIIPTAGVGNITCSAGVAVFLHGRVDFLTLYECADQALYHRKQNGRGGVSLYDSSMPEQPAHESHSVIGTAIASDVGNVQNEHLPQYVFRTLYDAKDTRCALVRLLEIVGRAYDVSRAYIFERSPDGGPSDITFEWCASGVPSQRKWLQTFCYVDELSDYPQNFDRQGVFYCNDLEQLAPALQDALAPLGIRSMLQCAITEEGRFWGGVGFDECRENRRWNSDQIASFKLTANVLATFLSQMRWKEQLEA